MTSPSYGEGWVAGLLASGQHPCLAYAFIISWRHLQQLLFKTESHFFWSLFCLRHKNYVYINICIYFFTLKPPHILVEQSFVRKTG